MVLHARLLTYLDEVVRQGSIRRAAEKLNVVPSAISRQIISLEENMDVALFHRAGRSMELTAAGEILIRHVRDTMRDMSRTQAMIEELKGLRRGSVNIALMSGLAGNIIPRAIVDFRTANPRVDVELRVMATGEEIQEAVERGDTDLGLGFDFTKRPSIRIIDSAAGTLGAVMRSDHPLVREAELRLADCTEYPLVMADRSTAIHPHMINAFESMNLKHHSIAETNSIEAMREIAKISDAICILTPFDIATDRQRGQLVYLPIHEFSRHSQKLMLIESARNSNALASMVGEKIKKSIAIEAHTSPPSEAVLR